MVWIYGQGGCIRRSDNRMGKERVGEMRLTKTVYVLKDEGTRRGGEPKRKKGGV